MRRNAATNAWAQRYRMALCRFLRKGPSAKMSSAERLGGQAASLGLKTLDVAGLHEEALHTITPREGSPGYRTPDWIERADSFFQEAMVPIEATHRAARKAHLCLERLAQTLQQRARESSASAVRLQKATARRQATEANAGAVTGRYDERLAEAKRMQKRLRESLRAILAQQEDERHRISGELRDEIAQALLATDISLLALKTLGQVHVRHIEKCLVNAQRILLEFTKRSPQKSATSGR